MHAEALFDPAGDAQASFVSRHAETAAINPYPASAIIQLKCPLTHNCKRIDHPAHNGDFLPPKTARVTVHRLDGLARRAGGQQ